MRAYSLDEGSVLVRSARSAIASRLSGQHATVRIEGFNERYGVFVTLETYPRRELRGCIGYLYGSLKVREAITDAALSAALRDPRFAPMIEVELNRVTVEVSLLSKPYEMRGSAHERENGLKIGRDGLIIYCNGHSGLLLPNVATEEGFNKLEFLSAVCEKAGLPDRTWKDPSAVLQRFETQIFREESPGGAVVESGSAVDK